MHEYDRVCSVSDQVLDTAVEREFRARVKNDPTARNFGHTHTSPMPYSHSQESMDACARSPPTRQQDVFASEHVTLPVTASLVVGQQILTSFVLMTLITSDLSTYTFRCMHAYSQHLGTILDRF